MIIKEAWPRQVIGYITSPISMETCSVLIGICSVELRKVVFIVSQLKSGKPCSKQDSGGNNLLSISILSNF